jgi:hypothetical protein
MQRTALRATLVRTGGPGQEAVLIIDGREYSVRDGFSWSAAYAPEVGDEFDVTLSAEIDDSWSWERIFAANPERRIGLESLGGYAYLALGRISSVNPVRIDCGILVEERAIHTHDSRVIGEFVGFRIEALDAEGLSDRKHDGES